MALLISYKCTKAKKTGWKHAAQYVKSRHIELMALGGTIGTGLFLGSGKAIREAGLVKRGKTFGRVFAPTMTREEYFANTIFSHRHKPEPVGLFKALLKREEVTQADLQQLLELVQKEIR